MNKLLLTAFFLLLASALFAQKEIDSMIYKLPIVNGRLVYADSIVVKGRNKTALDSTAKKWFAGYFKYHQPDTLQKDKDAASCVLSRGVLEYRIRPGLINIPFYSAITLKIVCKDGGYSYQVFDIYFRPENGGLNMLDYQHSPEYLIGLYKQKHIGFFTSMRVDRKMIRSYLVGMNTAVMDCVASLKEAMGK